MTETKHSESIIVLCADGLDPNVASDYGLSMPYQTSLSIPRELYFKGHPHTMNIWPSMFAGRIETYPGFRSDKDPILTRIRRGTRKTLRKFGIKWKRTGKSIEFTDEITYAWRVLNPEVEDTIFDNFDSFPWNIPGISPGFLFGVSNEYALYEYETLKKICIATTTYYDLPLVAIYSTIIDRYEHALLNTKLFYFEFFNLAKMISEISTKSVVLVSDHGCVDGEHTEEAYFGATFPISDSCKSVIDVRKELETRLNRPISR